ncbi:hypothetical protein SAMN05216410_3633 [Sanguibacter gelidistatuariae]|uniref:AMIN-like domain-containing protein n=1 Tax=Sanguibacter gelidistatuariae TaxID=1814289 RepID=A0A1G6WI79_9MICO|nr:hypothetical protein [Sanguibacter gelidistatuariae]SDD64756.1 hypothetical protein SAMN05216410_3633 [Sanguibacter gelidistatuariae]
MDAHTSRSRRQRKPVSIRVAAIAVGGALTLVGCDGYVNPGTPSYSTAEPAPTTSSPSEPAPPDSSTTTPEGGATTTAPPADDVTAPPPFPADTSPDTAEASEGAMLTVTDVRVAHHPGFDRVVYEMAGTGTPGWTVAYVSEAVQDGSGMQLYLAGEARLSVAISGSAYPSDSGATQFTHSTAVRGDGTTIVTEVVGWSVFEGITGSFIGITEPGHPFRAYLLDDPVRVVVDVSETRE